MSEVDEVGRVIEPRRADHLWPQIFAALAVVTVAYIAIGFVWVGDWWLRPRSARRPLGPLSGRGEPQ